MKKINYLALPLIVLSLCSCSKYKAFILVTENHGNQASMKFDEFEGQYEFKLKKKSAGDGAISFWGSVEDGAIDVTYVYNGVESLLFTVTSGESVRDQKGSFKQSDKIKIVVKSNCKSLNGDFTFNIN